MISQNFSKSDLTHYTSRQIEALFPLGNSTHRQLIEKYQDEAIERSLFCFSHVKFWKSNELNFLIGGQYTSYLYFLSNTIWKKTGDELTPTILFNLNKALNGFECFYKTSLPNVFAVSHTNGVVLADCQYSDFLVLHQGVTVGRIAEKRPVFLGPTLLYPHSAVIGASTCEPGTVVSIGVKLVNVSARANHTVFAAHPKIVDKAHDGSYFDQIFRR